MCAVPVHAEIAGTPVADVLTRARDEGITIIFSTQLVPPSLKVLHEPSAPAGLARIEEILAEHRLALSKVTDGVYAVVALPQGTEEPRPASGQAPSPATTTALGEVIVSSSRYALSRDDAFGEPAILTQPELQNLPRLADETLRAVQRLPGIATNGFSGLGSVRGGEPNETLIVLDGLPLYEPFHLRNFLGPVSLLDARGLDSMQVYAGGFPVEFGDRMSAVVDARSLQPPQPNYYEAGLSLFHASGLAAGEFDDARARWLLSARRSTLAESARIVETDIGDPTYYDARGRLQYSFSEVTRGALNALAARDRIDADSSDGAEITEVASRNGYLWGELEHDWPGGSHTRAIASFTDVQNEREGSVDEPGRRTGAVLDHRRFHIAGLQVEHTIPHEDSLYRLGGETRFLRAQYLYQSSIRFEENFPFPGQPARETVSDLDPEPTGWLYAAYASGRWSLGPRVTADAGLRWDQQTFDAVHAGLLSPRFALRFDPRPGTALRASWGRYYQAPGINELQVEDGIDTFFRAQRADHAIVSVEQALGGDWRLRVEAYRKDYSDLRPRIEALFDPLALLPELAPDRVRIAPSSALARGVEVLLARRNADHWNGWLSYSWSRVTDRIDGEDVLRSWDQTHSVSAGVLWSSGPWNVTLAGTWHTGWPTTAARLVVLPDGTATVETGARNEERFRHFLSIDARVSRRFGLPRGELEAYAEVTNLTDSANPCCHEYSVRTDGSGTPVLVREEDDWLGIVPSIGVLWRY